MPSYLFPSSGLYLLCLRPLQLRITLTGFPPFQFLASAPSFSFTEALQLIASALSREMIVVRYSHVKHIQSTTTTDEDCVRTIY